MNELPASKPNRWRRRFCGLFAACLVVTFRSSRHEVRALAILPLYAHDDNARGDAAYVMADGHAYAERLNAASDLYRLGRVPRIIILDEQGSEGYDFVPQELPTRVDRAKAYLVWFGVPAKSISTIPVRPNAPFGSLSESRQLAEDEPDIKSLVVVTSAPHTRRSRLCFRRSFPENIDVQIYSASTPRRSAEIDAPIWIEYVKFAVYYLVA